MGSVLYDFLSDSRLFDETLLASQFAHVPEEELVDELQRYREHCSKQIPTIVSEIPDADGTNLFFGRTPSLDVLKQTALYVPCHIVADPLLGYTRNRADKATEPFLRSAGLDPERLDRTRLSATVNFMRAVRPMIAGDCLRFWPTQLFVDPQRALEINYSASLFRNELPLAVYNLLKPKAIARTVFTSGGLSYVKPTLEPCRKLSVRFTDDDPNSAFFYVLHHAEPINSDDPSGSMQLAMSLPELPPDIEQFELWLEQSINRSALSFLERVLEEHRVAATCGAALALSSPLALEVLQSLALDTGGIPTATLNNLLELELPFADGLDLDTLVRIRLNEGDAFEEFRRALEVGSRELRLETDPAKLAQRRQNLVHQLIDVEVSRCAEQIATLRRRGIIEAVVAAVGLVGAVQTAGWSLLAALAAMTQGYRSYDTYRSQIKTTPGYFLWRLRQGSREA